MNQRIKFMNVKERQVFCYQGLRYIKINDREAMNAVGARKIFKNKMIVLV